MIYSLQCCIYQHFTADWIYTNLLADVNLLSPQWDALWHLNTMSTHLHAVHSFLCPADPVKLDQLVINCTLSGTNTMSLTIQKGCNLVISKHNHYSPSSSDGALWRDVLCTRDIGWIVHFSCVPFRGNAAKQAKTARGGGGVTQHLGGSENFTFQWP